MTVTIACPLGLSHDAINADTAPVWTDAGGNQYRVASGVIDGCEATPHTLATPSAITILIGPPGLDALATMGLTPPATMA